MAGLSPFCQFSPSQRIVIVATSPETFNNRLVLETGFVAAEAVWVRSKNKRLWTELYCQPQLRREIRKLPSDRI
jgi:hypothetical protein